MTLSTAAQEYRALRHDAARLDPADWRALRLSGPDARDFLQGLATQDLAGAEPGRAAESLFLNEKGRPLALGWVAFEASGDEAWVVADRASGDALRPHFERFRVMEEVEIEGPEGTPLVVAIAGPARDGSLARLAAEVAGSRALRADPLSFLLVPAAGRPVLEPASREAAEAWRLAVGLPRAGVDFDLDRIATELELPGAISLTKGCYVGQEVVARTSNRGQVRRRRIGFRFRWPGSAPGPRTALVAGGVSVGFVTSAAREPGSEDGLGMGYLTTDAIDPAGAVAFQASPGEEPTPVRVAPWPL